MKRLLGVALLACPFMHGQVIGLALSPAGVEDVAACPATTYPFRPRTVTLDMTGTAGDGVIYFCVYPVKANGIVDSGRFHIDYVAGMATFAGQSSEKIAFKMYVDGAILPLIADRVGTLGQYAVSQTVSWTLDVTSRTGYDLKDRPKADPHIYVDFRQANGTISPAKGSYLYLSGHYE